jgi:hypothetical protein
MDSNNKFSNGFVSANIQHGVEPCVVEVDRCGLMAHSHDIEFIVSLSVCEGGK